MNTNGLSDSELEIMRVIWEEDGKAYLSVLMGRLTAMGKTWKPNTVLTFLSRLIEKGMLTVEKQGRVNLYVALCKESDYTESLTQSFLRKFFGGDAKSLVASLLRQDRLSADDIAELQEFWKENKER
jgi:BlaI family penicillinase repressor